MRILLSQGQMGSGEGGSVLLPGIILKTWLLEWVRGAETQRKGVGCGQTLNPELSFGVSFDGLRKKNRVVVHYGIFLAKMGFFVGPHLSRSQAPPCLLGRERMSGFMSLRSPHSPLCLGDPTAFQSFQPPQN